MSGVLSALAGSFAPAAGGSYLVSVDVSGSTASGWTDTGSPNWAYTTSPIEGTYSLNCPAGTGNNTRVDFTAQSDVWVFVRARRDSTPTVNDEQCITLSTSGGSTRLAAVAGRGSVGWMKAVATANETSVGSNLSNGVNWAIWMHYVKGTGSNATIDVWISTDGTETRPGSTYVSMTNGTSTGDAVRLTLGAMTSTNFVFDKIRVSASEIGSNPS